MHAGEARVWHQCLPPSSPSDFFGTKCQSEPELASVARLAVQEAPRAFWKSFSSARMTDRTLQQPFRWALVFKLMLPCCLEAHYSLIHPQDTQPFLQDRVSPGLGWPCTSHRVKENLESLSLLLPPFLLKPTSARCNGLCLQSQLLGRLR